MRKIKLYIILILPLIAISLSSCDKFLDEVPDNRVALVDLDKASQLLTNAYSISSYGFTDWMTDNVGYTLGVNIRLNQQQSYEWEDVTAGPGEQDTPIFFWFETYNAIAHANEVLNVLNDLPAVTEEEQAHKKAIEAEALLTRAYGHFMLVNLFGAHYSETAGSDLGVPYLTSPETKFIQSYTRNTVDEVYDLVEIDMLRGISLVDDSFYSNSGKYHFNRNAALAFASRFYLFKGEYDKCIDYSTMLLGSNGSNYVRDMTSEEFQNASSSITGYPQLYSSPDLPGNLMLMRKISLVQRLDFAHGPTETFYGSLFAANPFSGTTDARENPAFVKGDNGLFPVRYESLFERSSLSSNVGYPYHIAIAFRGEEVLLNRAEAYVYDNQVSNAIADLQVLVNKRYYGSGSTTLTIDDLRSLYGVLGNPFVSDQTVVLEYVLLEKRKEFLAQGLRWFDIKRYELEVRHQTLDGSTIRLRKDDKRKVLQIPVSAVEVGGLEPNPR